MNDEFWHRIECAIERKNYRKRATYHDGYKTGWFGYAFHSKNEKFDRGWKVGHKRYLIRKKLGLVK